jgi:hypothetical protein
VSLLGITSVFGQTNLASTGVVTDSTNAVLPGVIVKVLNVDTGIDRSMVTDLSGNYTVSNLAPGRYELRAEVPGFRSYLQQGIVMQVGEVLRSDVRLELGAVNEAVHVDASIVTINTESGTIKGDVIVQEEIQELINRR